MKKIIALLLTLFLASITAPAQYRWLPIAGHKQEALYDGLVQVGVWDHDRGKYWPLVFNGFGGSTWGKESEPPLPPPIRNYGVDRAQPQPGRTRQHHRRARHHQGGPAPHVRGQG